MPLPADHHMHTPLCRHAIGEPTEYAAQALMLRLNEIGFTDHSPMKRDDFDNWRMRFDQLAEYVAKVRRAQRDYLQVTIRLGLEVDFIPGQEDWIRELAAMHPWDYFIGSVHYVSESWDVDNPEKLSNWKDRDPYEVWSIYFERLTMAAESKLFEIIGHADLPKKFCFYPQRDCTPLFERFLDAAQKANVAIELNTAGWRKECKEIYPAPAIVRLAHSKGVPITFGSDAHAPNEVGMDLPRALEVARRVGYSQRCRFVQRQRDFVPL